MNRPNINAVKIIFEGGVFKYLRLPDADTVRMEEAFENQHVCKFEHDWDDEGYIKSQTVIIDFAKVLHVEYVPRVGGERRDRS